VSNRGLTLAETLLAVGLAVVLVLLVMALALAASNANQKGSDSLTANGVLQGKLEEFIYSLPPSTDSFWTQTSFASPYQQDSQVLSGTQYFRAIYLSDSPAAAGGTKVLTARVSWQGGTQGRMGQGSQTTSVTRLIYAR